MTSARTVLFDISQPVTVMSAPFCIREHGPRWYAVSVFVKTARLPSSNCHVGQEPLSFTT